MSAPEKLARPPGPGAVSTLFLVPSFRVGGAERVLVRVANALAESGQSVTVAVIDNVGLLASQLDRRIAIVPLDVGRTIYAFPAFIRLVRRLRPNTVFSTLTRANILVLMCRPGFPPGTRVVVRQPVAASLEARTPRIGWIYRFLIRRFYPRADLVICQSRAMTGDMSKEFGVPLDRLVTLGNPAPAVDIARERLGPSPFRGLVNFLAVGRLVPEKGYETLIYAFSEVVSRMKEARLVILGVGPMEERLRALVDSLGLSASVELAGLTSDPTPYYVHASAVVLASVREGFPNCLVESLACGTPVVATDCSGAAVEIVRPGSNGFLVDVGNVQQLASAMLKVLELARNSDRRAIADSVSDFSAEKILGRYVELMADASSQSRPAHA